MGLFSKVKDILFEEEEVTEAIPQIKEEPVAKRVEKPIEKEEVHEHVHVHVEEPKQVVKEVDEDESPIRIDTISDEDLFAEKSFPFQDFDEEEFSNSFPRKETVNPNMSRVQKPKNVNVLEYERNKKIEKTSPLGRPEAIQTPVDRKKFKPSPIISPVYGILNEDYRIEDIRNRNEEETLTIEEVRKKAFEPEKEDKVVKETLEDTVTVKIKEPEEEKIQKVKTIDDLLEDTTEEVIDIKPTQNDDYDIEYDEVKEEKEVEPGNRFDDDETLENDLFDLIDSMYDQREDGEF